MDFCISQLIRLLFETGMRSNALAYAYIHLKGISVMIHILYMRRSNTPTLRTAKKCNKWLSSRHKPFVTLQTCICAYVVIINSRCHKIQFLKLHARRQVRTRKCITVHAVSYRRRISHLIQKSIALTGWLFLREKGITLICAM